MTSTHFENKITMGNVLTVVAMLVAVVAAYSNLQAKQVQFEKEAEVMGQRIDTGEARIRALEQASATASARFESLAQSMGEVKAEIRQTNELLRRLIPGAAE